MHESSYKQLKQPLSNGNNTLDYINDYIHLQELLFGKINDYRIDDAFYEFRNRIVHGYDGTLFLKTTPETISFFEDKETKAYPGSKNTAQVNALWLEDREELARIVQITLEHLPIAKPKKKK